MPVYKFNQSETQSIKASECNSFSSSMDSQLLKPCCVFHMRETEQEWARKTWWHWCVWRGPGDGVCVCGVPLMLLSAQTQETVPLFIVLQLSFLGALINASWADQCRPAVPAGMRGIFHAAHQSLHCLIALVLLLLMFLSLALHPSISRCFTWSGLAFPLGKLAKMRTADVQCARTGL